MTEIPVVDLGGAIAMPMVGFGTWALRGQRGYEAIRHALAVGYRHVDTATMYRNEDEVGRAIADSGLGRDERGVAVEGYSPLKGTRLRDPVLAEIAAEHKVTPAQVVLRWHVELGITVIPKSSRPERIASNLDLFGFSLTAEDMARLNRL